MIKRFLLEEFSLYEHPVFGTLDINLGSSDYNSEMFFKTLLLGQNGTGKSLLLRAIIDVFRELNSTILNYGREHFLRGGFRIKYRVLGNQYEVINSAYLRRSDVDLKRFRRDLVWGIACTRNGQVIPLEKLKLPKMVVAAAINITDKFPTTRETEKNPFYVYLGIRNPKSPNTSGTRSYVKRIVDLLVQGSKRQFFKNNLIRVLKFNGLLP